MCEADAVESPPGRLVQHMISDEPGCARQAIQKDVLSNTQGAYHVEFLKHHGDARILSLAFGPGRIWAP